MLKINASSFDSKRPFILNQTTKHFIYGFIFLRFLHIFSLVTTIAVYNFITGRNSILIILIAHLSILHALISICKILIFYQKALTLKSSIIKI